jgi:hypothetical protein
MFQPLRDAVADQYTEFTAPRPRAMHGCECCATAQQLSALVAAPREQLTASVLDFYARKAMTTVGGAFEFRYFWPRLAELAVQGELTTDREIVFGKPHYGAHHTWPEDEQRAILRLAGALGQWIAGAELEPDEVDGWVCAVGQLAEGLADVRPLIAPLLAETPAAWTNLRALVEWNRDSMQRKHQLSNAFWENAPTSAAAIVAWLGSKPGALAALHSLELEHAQLYGTPLPDEPTIVPPAS